MLATNQNDYKLIDGKYEYKRIPLEESAGKLKYVDPDSQMIKEAKMLGISFGD
mgnify:CR=1 FL=1